MKKFDPKNLAAYGTIKKFLPDSKIITEGESGEEMFIILQGKVHVEVGEVIVSELVTGDFFGEMSLIDKEPRSATVSAVESTMVLVVNEKNFERIIAWEPVIAIRIMKGLTKRIREINSEIKGMFKEAMNSSELNEHDSVIDLNRQD